MVCLAPTMCARRCTLQTAQCLVLVICSTAGALQDSPHELVATCVAKMEAVDGKVAALVSRVAVLEEELNVQAQTTSKLEKTIASQQAELVALRAEPRSRVHTDGEPEGRRLSAPTTQRSMWHESIFHKFDVPDSTGCGLHAELHSSAEPLLIGRASTGNLTMKYSAGVAFSAEAPFIMTHPSGCTRPTLTLNADTDVAGTLSVSGVAMGAGPTWIDLYNSGFLASGVSYQGLYPFYAIHDGFVHFHGCLYKATWSYGDTIMNMPAGARPYGAWYVFLYAATEGDNVPIRVEGSTGIMTMQRHAGVSGKLCLDGVFYRKA